MGILKATFPNLGLFTFVSELEKNFRGCKSILDVGCGDNSPIGYLKLNKKFTVGLDGYPPAIAESKKRRLHDSYQICDIRDLDASKLFDAVIALDVIEHLNKKEGHKFLENLESIAQKRVIINTPNGFIPQHNKDNNLQTHKSGWNIKDFTKRGYRVYGMYGWKLLRGEEAGLKYWPKSFWMLISVATHYLFTRKHPDYAFSLFAVKNMSPSKL